MHSFESQNDDHTLQNEAKYDYYSWCAKYNRIVKENYSVKCDNLQMNILGSFIL